MQDSNYQSFLQALPDDWIQVTIKELGSIFSGATPSRNIPSFWNGNIAWITPGELATLKSKYISEAREYITNAGLDSCAAKLLPQGTLIVTTRATIGSVAIADMELCTNQGFKNIILNESNDTLFYYYLLSWIAPEMRRLASGSTFDEISRSDFGKIIVPQPSLPEQRRIATILDTLDRQLQHTERLIAKLKHQKSGLLNDLLTRGIDEHGRLRDPLAHPEQFEDSPLGKIPKGWVVSNIGKLGFWSGGSTPSKAIESNWLNGNIAWISPKDVQGPEISDSQDKITLSAVQNNGITLFEKDSIIVVFRSGILRHTFPVSIATIPFTVNQDIKVLMPEQNVHHKFAFFLLQNMGSIILKNAVKAGTTVESIDLTTFLSLEACTPVKKDEQERIASILTTFDDTIRTEETYLAKLQLYKQGLMHDLLTGRVRVGESDDVMDMETLLEAH